MKSLKYFIQESLVNNKQPKNLDELKTIIVKRFQEQGPGTKKQPIDFNDIDVSKINTFFEDGVGLFQEMEERKLQPAYIDISNWNVSNVKNMSYMFYGCKKLVYVGDLSNWDVSKVEDMQDMFSNSGITSTPSWYKE